MYRKLNVILLVDVATQKCSEMKLVVFIHIATV